MKRTVVPALCALLLLLAVVPAAAAIGLNDITPDVGDRGTTVTCTVTGSFYYPYGLFYGNPSFQLLNGASTIDGTTVSWDQDAGTQATVTFTIPADATIGLWTLQAQQFAFAMLNTVQKADAFSVRQPPVIASLNPASGTAGSGDLTVTVLGKGFQPAGFFDRESYVTVNGTAVTTTYTSTTALTAVFPAAVLAAPGTLSVRVVNSFILGDAIVSAPRDFPVTAPTPAITAISPASATAGAAGFSLGVTGLAFLTGASGAVVRWNDTDLATTRDSATHLTAAVPASLVATAGSATVTVRNGGAGAPLSNGQVFTIGDLVPVLTSISPTMAWAGYVKNDLVLTATGSNFAAGARVRLGAAEKAGTTFVDSTQLRLPLTAADLATAGTVMVGVKNPPPATGAVSAATLPLTVQAETTDPAVTISGAGSGWHNAAVPLTFAASDAQSGVQKLRYMAPPAVGSWTDGASYTVPASAQGTTTVSVQALDWCGRAGGATVAVNIDTTRPETEALGNATVFAGKRAKLKYRVTEPAGLSPRADVVIKVKRGSGKVVKTVTASGAAVNTARTAAFTCTLKKGTYTWYVYATDLAGNTQANVAKAKLTVK